MIIYEGKAVFEGVAIGKLSVYKKAEQFIKREKIEDPEAEISRYEEARNTAVMQLQVLYDKAVKEVGESGAEIFEAHQISVMVCAYKFFIQLLFPGIRVILYEF